MWFIFPQLAGLGRSGMAQHYAIRDLEQAKRYLAHSILGPRLRQVVKLLMDQKGKSAFEILGSPDDLKLRSCLTLFREAASKDSSTRSVEFPTKFQRPLWPAFRTQLGRRAMSALPPKADID
jgi:uncharacterized protein (DUF1810 family)